MIELELNDIAEITSSKRIFYSDYVEEGIPFYRSREIINLDNGEDLKELIFITQEKYLDIKNKFGAPEKDDILITSVGTIGNTYIVRENDEFYFKDGNLTWLRNWKGKTEPKFVFYWLKSPIGQGKLYQQLIGSSQKALTIAALKKIKIEFPEDKTTQRKIASILAGYDDLIENNLKRIKLLEEKALMEYRMLFSENELNEFPLEDVWDIKYGKNLPQTKITEIGKYPVYGAAGRIGFYEEFNYEFPVALVTSRGNGSGVAHRTNQAAFVTNNSFAFVPKEKFVNVHFHLAEMILRDLELTQLRSGTAQPQLTIAGLIGVKLKLPNKESLVEFNKTVDPVFDLIHTLEKQNTKLREARDILLPKLMNGQIEV